MTYRLMKLDKIQLDTQNKNKKLFVISFDT